MEKIKILHKREEKQWSE